jgi:hypothetical protein
VRDLPSSERGGADPRVGRNPGVDKGTIDDVLGSPGIVSLDRAGRPEPNPQFGDGPQVTPRAAPSNFGALWADELFWDGRASLAGRRPAHGAVAIARGGAREPGPRGARRAGRDGETRPLVDRRHGHDRARAPLALATDLPKDVEAARAARPTYPALFEAAFGDSRVTPIRVAFAIASRGTLLSDQTAWDRYAAGDERALAGRAFTDGGRYKRFTAPHATRRRNSRTTSSSRLACAAPRSIAAASSSPTTQRTPAT